LRNVFTMTRPRGQQVTVSDGARRDAGDP
jgi:hypothetical protein